jgi:acyl CoA:acetate/3-ketoacid CoA transferase
MLPLPVLDAIESRFLTEGHPRELTWFDIFPTGLAGIEPLAHKGLLKCVISGWYTLHPRLRELILANDVAGYCFPLGTLAFWCRTSAAGQALLTETGLDTYMDPSHPGPRSGGQLNRAAAKPLVERVEFDDGPQLRFPPMPVDIAIIRGTTVDRAGNLSLEDEQVTMSVLYQALAAKRRPHGQVIVQASQLVEEGDIPARNVAVPGELVDQILIHPQAHIDESAPMLDWLDQEARLPRPPRQVLLDHDTEVWRRWQETGAAPPSRERRLTADVIAGRRALMELGRGELINLGLGPPMRDVAAAAVDDDIDPELRFSVETGVLGGVLNGRWYRSGVTSILETPDIFSLYTTSVMDASCLGMLEFDAQGNVNLLAYGNTIVGPGGSMDIAAHIDRLVFLGPFRAGGLDAVAENGELHIHHEGKFPRGVNRVQSVCFNGPRMFEQGKSVLYVTERAVFQLTEDGPTLVEIAPGVDLQRDLLAQMEFSPTISPDLRPMDSRIFRPGPIGIRDDWNLPPLN